jgi:hypothetical protein
MSFGKRQPIGFSGVDRRRDKRERTDIAAQIVLPATHVKCRVIDLSKSGALVAAASVFGLPDRFELWAGGQTYQVIVMRRSTGHIGVKFV